jgi:hypothetical protein
MARIRDRVVVDAENAWSPPPSPCRRCRRRRVFHDDDDGGGVVGVVDDGGGGGDASLVPALQVILRMSERQDHWSYSPHKVRRISLLITAS